MKGFIQHWVAPPAEYTPRKYAPPQIMHDHLYSELGDNSPIYPNHVLVPRKSGNYREHDRWHINNVPIKAPKLTVLAPPTPNTWRSPHE